MKKLYISFFVYLMIIFLNELKSQDTLSTYLSSLDSDSSRLSWIGIKVNELVLSQPTETIKLAEVYDSIASLQNDKIYKAKALNILGVAQLANGYYDLAANYYLQTIEIIENTDERQLLGQVLGNLATCFRFRKENSKSIEYYLKALNIAVEVNDTTRIAMLSNNLGMQYVESKNFKAAEPLYNKAILLYHDLNQPIYEGISLLSRANLRIETASYSLAIQDYQHAMKLVPEQMVPLLHAASIAGIGSAYNRMGQSSRAEPFLLSSLEKARAINHTEQLKESHRELSDLYESKRNFEKALYHHRSYKAAHDEMFSSEQDQALVDALTKYEAEKRQQEIALLESQSEISALRLANSRRRTFFFGAGLLLFAGLSFLLLRLKNQIQSKNQIISKSLGEKEILLREIHHRVKNNLQFISSLLGLQTEHVQDSVALGALQEGQDRVQSMALIHQNLYQEDNLTGVDMKDYFIQLINNLFDSYNIREDQVELRLEIGDINLDVDTVIPIGLVVNELISNSLKYAFPNDRKGSITVFLSEQEKTLNLTVQDDGIGFPKEEHNQLGESFGYRLVHAFKEQLHADLIVESKKGTKVQMVIKNYDVV